VIIGLSAMDPTQPMLGVGVVQVPQAN